MISYTFDLKNLDRLPQTTVFINKSSCTKSAFSVYSLWHKNVVLYDAPVT